MVFHWPLSDMLTMPVAELINWHKLARERYSAEEIRP